MKRFDVINKIYKNNIIEYILCFIIIGMFVIMAGIFNYYLNTENRNITEISKVNLDSYVNEASTSNYKKVSIFEYDKLTYYIKVNYKTQVVTIYTTDDNGNYTIPVKEMICSTGESTPEEGIFEISDKYEWRCLVGNVYGQYASRITGSILFHSVPYTKQDKSTLEYWEYDKLGEPVSKGCVRLTVEDAKWIFDYCESGTKVEFCSNDNNVNNTKKQIKISGYSEELRNWDPTDPDPDNPWIEYKEHNKGENE